MPAYVLGRGRPNRKYPPLGNRAMAGTVASLVAAGTGGATIITPLVTEPGALAAFGVGGAAVAGTAGAPPRPPDGVAEVFLATSNSGLAVLASAGVTTGSTLVVLASPGAGFATLASPGLGQAAVQI